MSYNPNFEEIGNSLVQLYYSKFDVGTGQERAMNLQELYDVDNSIMTFEGAQFRGRNAILEKFAVSIHYVIYLNNYFRLSQFNESNALSLKLTRSRYWMDQSRFLCSGN
jgi:hypothetical protein